MQNMGMTFKQSKQNHQLNMIPTEKKRLKKARSPLISEYSPGRSIEEMKKTKY